MTKTQRTQATKLVVDGGLAVALLALWSLALTGLVIHEWLGVAIVAVLVVHLLLNWMWIVATTRRFVRVMRTQVRLNYIVNAALMVAMTVVIFSGLMISRVALPAFGIEPTAGAFLRILHILSSDVLMVIVGLHLGMNWKWVLNTIRVQILKPLRGGPGRVALTPPAAPSPREQK